MGKLSDLRTTGNNVLEQICLPADGSSLVGVKATYTSENAGTGQQTSSTTITKLTGSGINYIPPTGTNMVIYEYHVQIGWRSSHAITHFRFYIDGNECTRYRATYSSQYYEDKVIYKIPIEVGPATSYPDAKVNVWDNPRFLEVRGRRYGNSNYSDYNITQYWDGGGTDVFSRPVLQVTAIK